MSWIASLRRSASLRDATRKDGVLERFAEGVRTYLLQDSMALVHALTRAYTELMDEHAPRVGDTGEATQNEALAQVRSRAHEVQEEPYTTQVEWEPATEEERAACEVVDALRNAGGDAYFVGGYPRGLAMRDMPDVYPDFHFAPHDIDIVTSLAPDRIEEVLAEAGMGQKSHGKSFQVCQASVRADDTTYTFEVAAYRMEGEYSDGRRPDTTAVTNDVREDIARRDFTMNGLLFDPTTNALIDYSSGLKDLAERRLAFIGSAAERISEDGLRMFRYVRFRAKYRLGFDMDAAEAMRANAGMVEQLPGDRIKGELDRIVTLRRSAFAVADLARLGLLDRVLPEVAALHSVKHTPEGVQPTIHKEGDVFTHTLRVLRAVERPEYLAAVREVLGIHDDVPADAVIEQFYARYGSAVAWALLFHDIGKRDTQEYHEATDERTARYSFHGHEERSAELFEKLCASKRIAFSNEEKQHISFLLRHHSEPHHIHKEDYAIRGQHARMVWKSGDAEALLFMGLADTLGNYHDGGDATSALEGFRASREKLAAFRDEEARTAWVHEHGRGVSALIIDALHEIAGHPQGRGSVLVKPLKDMALARMRTGELSPEPEAQREAVREMVTLLNTQGLTQLPTSTGKRTANAESLRSHSDRVVAALRAHYNVVPEDVL